MDLDSDSNESVFLSIKLSPRWQTRLGFKLKEHEPLNLKIKKSETKWWDESNVFTSFSGTYIIVVEAFHSQAEWLQ